MKSVFDLSYQNVSISLNWHSEQRCTVQTLTKLNIDAAWHAYTREWACVCIKGNILCRHAPTLNWKLCLLCRWMGKCRGREWKRLVDEKPTCGGKFPQSAFLLVSPYSEKHKLSRWSASLITHNCLTGTSASLEWKDNLIMELLFQTVSEPAAGNLTLWEYETPSVV